MKLRCSTLIVCPEGETPIDWASVGWDTSGVIDIPSDDELTGNTSCVQVESKVDILKGKICSRNTTSLLTKNILVSRLSSLYPFCPNAYPKKTHLYALSSNLWDGLRFVA